MADPGSTKQTPSLLTPLTPPTRPYRPRPATLRGPAPPALTLAGGRGSGATRQPSGGGRLRADPRSPSAASSPGPRARRPARHEGRPAAAGHWRAQRTGPGASPASTCPTSGASARASAPPPEEEVGRGAMRMRHLLGSGRAAFPERQLAISLFSRALHPAPQQGQAPPR